MKLILGMWQWEMIAWRAIVLISRPPVSDHTLACENPGARKQGADANTIERIPNHKARVL